MAERDAYIGDVRLAMETEGDRTFLVVKSEAAAGESTGLTDAQLRASPVATAPNITRGAGNVDANTQRVTLAADGPTVTAIGAQADAAAAADGTGNYSIIAALKRGLLNWAALLARIPALVNGRVPVNSTVPTATSAVIMPLQTAATGTNWVAFTSQACVALDIANNSGVTIEYRRGAAGTAMQIPAYSSRMVVGITNANQIDVRRTDTSNTQITIQAEAFTL